MNLLENPIIARELKERMRAFRAPVMLTIYLLFLGMMVFGLERAQANSFDGGASAVTGLKIFHWLLFLLLLFVCFMVPAFTASLISSERERQTFHLVQVTLLTPFQIVTGKLGASVSWLLLLLVATLPLMAVATVLGGVTFVDLIVGIGMVMLTGVLIAALSIAVSSRVRRSAASTVLSFMLVLALTVGTPMAFGLVEFWYRQDSIVSGRTHRTQTWTLALNPFVGTAAAVHRENNAIDTPISSLGSFIRQADEPPNRVFVGQEAEFQNRGNVFVGNGAPEDLPAPAVRRVPAPLKPRDRLIPFWAWTILWDLALIAAALRFAMGGVSAPTQVFRSGRKRKSPEGA